METRTVKVSGFKVNIPAYFSRMRKAPKEVKGMDAHVAQTDIASCLLLFEYDKALTDVTFEKEPLIRTIHDDVLDDNQGLIAAEVGEIDGRPYLYTILKTMLDDDGIPKGVEYALTMLVAWKKGTVRIRGYFTEAGTTGMRDSMVFAMRSGKVGGMDATLEGWTQDPYDPSRRVGALMNVSEREEFDSMFPAHPLSVAREVVRCILGEGDGGEPQGEGNGDEEKAPPAESTGKLLGRVAEAAGGVAEKVGKAADAMAGAASEAADVVAKAAGDTASAIGDKVDEIKATKDEPDEYDKAVVAYNMAYTDLSDAGLDLRGQRVRAIDLIGHVEELVNSIANHPKSFDRDLGETTTHRAKFKEAEDFARAELSAARASAAGAGAGVAAGMAVASMAPSAALWVATTFGTASTGTAISTLSGAAATNAALAWLGGGTLAAGGGGTAAGTALLAMAGPIGWGIAGATLLASIVLFAKSRFDIRDEKEKELTAIKRNTEAVSETAAEVDALIAKTVCLRDKLSTLFSTCMASYGSDYSRLSPDEQHGLAAMVNDTLALSRLLNERVGQGDE